MPDRPDMSEFERMLGDIDDPSPFVPASDQVNHHGLAVIEHVGAGIDLAIEDICNQVNAGHNSIVQYILTSGLSLTAAVVSPRVIQIVVQLPADEKPFVVFKEGPDGQADS